MSLRETVKQVLRMCGHAAVSTVHDRLNGIEASLNDSLATDTALLQSNIQLVESVPALQTSVDELAERVEMLETRFEIRHETSQAVILQTSDQIASDPEWGLIAFLYSYLPTRTALFCGARCASGSSTLEKAGYEILCLGTSPISADVSLVLLDRLECAHALDNERPPVVCVTLQSDQVELSDIVREMRPRGYGWFIVIYRVRGRDRAAFFCNYDVSLSDAAGQVFFFADREIFSQAQHWCAAVLPRTIFKAVANAGGAER